MAPGVSSKAKAANADMQARFVAEYLIDLNGTKAYRRANPACKTDKVAAVMASRLLSRVEIQEAVAEGNQKRLAKTELTAERVLEEIARIAFFDPATMYDKDGRLLPIHKMPPATRACIAGVEVAQANFDKKDGKKSDEWLTKIRHVPKHTGLDMAAKYFKLTTETKVEVTGDWEKLAARLRSARQRTGK